MKRDDIKVGFRICFEVRFPEYFRELFKENVMTVISVNSTSYYQTSPTAVININGNVLNEVPRNMEYLMVYEYQKPAIGFGEEGRIFLYK
ncbi:MAG: hypothetical protein GX206_06470 [Clostridiales bacterium]|nr:hypothetical protein [Clostridiales bacterium]